MLTQENKATLLLFFIHKGKYAFLKKLLIIGFSFTYYNIIYTFDKLGQPPLGFIYIGTHTVLVKVLLNEITIAAHCPSVVSTGLFVNMIDCLGD